MKIEVLFSNKFKLLLWFAALVVLCITEIVINTNDTTNYCEGQTESEPVKEKEHDAIIGDDGACDNDQRVRYYLDQCEKNGWTDKESMEEIHTYRNLYCDDARKILYCEIPKVGSTTMVKFLINLAKNEINQSLDFRHQFDDKKLRKVAHVSQIRHKLDTYKKILIVRHPLDRLLSAYHDKFANGVPNVAPFKYDDARMAQLMDSHFGRDYSAEKRVNLHEFLHLVAEERESRGFFDRHWDTYYRICHACEVQYNYILRLETFDRDMADLLPSLGNTGADIMGHYHNNRNVDPHTALSKANPELRAVDSHILEKLQTIFEKDMTMFGYTWSAEEGAGCSISTNSTANVCC